MGSAMRVEEGLEGQQGGRAERIRRLLVAVAAPPVGDAACREGVGFWEGEDEGGREGGARRRAGHHGGAQGLPVLRGVQGAGQVHLGHRARRLHLGLGHEVQRLLQDGGVQVRHLHQAVRDGGGGQAAAAAAAAAGEDGVGDGGEGGSAGGHAGLRLRGHAGGQAGVGGGQGHHREVRVQVGGDLADGLVGSQDELQPLLLLQKVGNVVLQARLLVLQLIGFLEGGEKEEVA